MANWLIRRDCGEYRASKELARSLAEMKESMEQFSEKGALLAKSEWRRSVNFASDDRATAQERIWRARPSGWRA